MAFLPQTGISGVAQKVRDLFAPKKKGVEDKSQKVDPKRVDPGYPSNAALADRVKALIYRYYKEGSFEKVQFSRKWMRNILLYQGYQDLEWSDVVSGWEVTIADESEYAFPNNYFRSHVLYGVGLYVKNAPEFAFQPTANDFEAYAVASAAKAALEVIKKNVQYDAMRAREAIALRLLGNSFRYSYYSLDPRYGFTDAPVWGQEDVEVDEGVFHCPVCGATGEGTPLACPQCGASAELELRAPTVVSQPKQIGMTRYPRGQVMTEVVSSLEVYVRSSAVDLWNAPYLIRARMVDKIVLAAMYQDKDVASTGTETASGEDLSLTYSQTLAELPGDPTQFSSWYEKSTAVSKSLLVQGWIRPSLYFHDAEMLKEFPDGLYGACAGDVLLETKSDSLDDQWVHLVYTPVPGRFWGDGDDDLVPKQLQLNEVDRLITRNIAYNSVPQLFIDSQRITKDNIVNDPGEIIEVKPGGGKPTRDAIFQTSGMPLTSEVHQWRAYILEDFQYHSGVFGSAIGQHQPGIDTLGGQAMMADRSEQNQSPMLLLYKTANELWATQVLKLAAANWLDERVSAVMGVNGNWEFSKLRGAALDMDKIKLDANIIPQDYVQQQAFTQAIATGALNPQDPRVARKLLLMYQLPTELDNFSMDAKVQWKEIERMKAGEQGIMPVSFVHNDAIHMEICRVWLNSDEAEGMPEVAAAVYQHMLIHMQNQLVVAEAQAAVGAASGAAENDAGGGAGADAAAEKSGAEGQQGKGGANKTNRAKKGQAAKPKTSQPSSGNQFGRSRR